jgi:beta-lactamase class A
MTRLAAVFLALLAAMPLAAEPTRRLTSKEALLWADLQAHVTDAVEHLDGVAGVVVEDLETGATIAVHAEELFPVASSIKLGILYELFLLAEQGRIDLREVQSVPEPRAGGDGVLQLLGAGVRLDWHDLAVLMVAVSDNAATNVLIDRVGMKAVNERLNALGLPNTRLRRRMMDLEAARRGDENVSTPKELLALVKAVHAGRGLRPESARDLRTILAVAKDSPFREPLPETVSVFDKPGSLEGVRCVAAVVALPRRPYAVTLLTTYLRDDAAGEAFIRKLSATIFATFDRLDRAAPETGRVISDR